MLINLAPLCNLVICDRDEGVGTLHLPTGLFKKPTELDPVLRGDPSTGHT